LEPMSEKAKLLISRKKRPGTPLWKAVLLERRMPLRYQRQVGIRFSKITRFLITNLIFKKIRKTKSFTTNPNAGVEIHSGLCHCDMDIYLIAIKSFLRFYSSVAVVVHNDGTLTDEDRKLLRKHIVGIRIINKKEADIIANKILADKPNCKLRRHPFIFNTQIFDYPILSNTEKLISLDSDIVFIKKPTEIINWIKKDDAREVLFNSEGKIGYTDDAREKGIYLKAHINIGFVCYFKDSMNFDLIEDCLGKIRNTPLFYIRNINQVLFDSCISQSDKYKYQPLDEKEYVVYFGQTKKDLENAKMVHFVTFLRYAQMHYIRYVKQTIKELNNKIILQS